jgi:hypothetical protein
MSSLFSVAERHQGIGPPDSVSHAEREVRQILTAFFTEKNTGLSENAFNALKKPLERSLMAWMEVGEVPSDLQHGVYNLAAVVWVSIG